MEGTKSGESDADKRLTAMMIALLEGQFPVAEDNGRVPLRTASDFASALNVHVNHLNRALKNTTWKTTTATVNEYFIREAKRLLTRSDWKINRIAWALGFKEAHHFSAFFKKHVGISPLKFREASKLLP